jgi:hypothetical protein
MLRFFLRVSIVLFAGVAVLSLFAPDLVGQFLFYCFIAGLVSVVLKLGLDIYLHFAKEKEDVEDESLLGEPEAKTYYDIEEYMKEKKRRDLND